MKPDLNNPPKNPEDITYNQAKAWANPNCKECWGRGTNTFKSDNVAGLEEKVCACVKKRVRKVLSAKREREDDKPGFHFPKGDDTTTPNR